MNAAVPPRRGCSAQVMAPTRLKRRSRRRNNAAAGRSKAVGPAPGGAEETAEPVAVVPDDNNGGGTRRSSRRKAPATHPPPAPPPQPSPPPLSGDASPDSKCPICLDRISRPAFLQRCQHRFCFPCIQEWSRAKAECPLCKQPFSSIIHALQPNEPFKEYRLRRAVAAATPELHQELEGVGEVTRRRRRRRRRQEEEEEEEWSLPPQLLYLPEEGGRPPAQSSRRLTQQQRAFRRALYRTGVRGIAGGNNDDNNNEEEEEEQEGEIFVPSNYLSELRPFLLTTAERTDLFLHQLLRRAARPPPATPPSVICISEDDREGAGWDDETPGPSYSSADPCPSPGPPPQGGEGGECEFVSYKKPMAERTPELVHLSSDSEGEAPPAPPPTSPPACTADKEEGEVVGAGSPRRWYVRPRSWSEGSGVLSPASSPSPSPSPCPYPPSSSVKRGRKRGESASSSSDVPPSPSFPSPPSCHDHRHRGSKPGGKRKYKSRHLDDDSAGDPPWQPGCCGDQRQDESRRRRRSRSSSVEIVYEGKVCCSSPPASKRLRRSRKSQRTSSPLVITIDSDSNHDDGRLSPSVKQAVDFSVPGPPLAEEPCPVGGAPFPGVSACPDWPRVAPRLKYPFSVLDSYHDDDDDVDVESGDARLLATILSDLKDRRHADRPPPPPLLRRGAASTSAPVTFDLSLSSSSSSSPVRLSDAVLRSPGDVSTVTVSRGEAPQLFCWPSAGVRMSLATPPGGLTGSDTSPSPPLPSTPPPPSLATPPPPLRAPPIDPKCVLAPPIDPQCVAAPPIDPKCVLAPPIDPQCVAAPPIDPQCVLTPPIDPKCVLAPPIDPQCISAPPIDPHCVSAPPGGCQWGSGLPQFPLVQSNCVSVLSVEGSPLCHANNRLKTFPVQDQHRLTEVQSDKL